MGQKLRVKKGDSVIVRTGRDRGKQGEVIQVMPKEERLLVRGVNVVKRHMSPRPGNPGGIVDKEAPIHVSNVALVDPKDGKATRVGYKTIGEDRKVRYAKRSGEIIDG